MLSAGSYAQIGRLTEAALREIGGHEVIERVTVIRGYEELLGMYPERADFEQRLAKGILDLQHVAERHHSAELALDLQGVLEQHLHRTASP